MPYVQVLPSETLPELIERAGPQFSVEAIKGHEKNAHLFKSRTTYLLKTGDVIWIPEGEAERKWFSLSKGQNVRFVVHGKLRPFKILLRYPEGTAKADAKQRLLELRANGVDISDAEAETILVEGCLQKEAIQTRMKELEGALQNVNVVLEGAANSLRVVE
jgi:hypothetical protein